MPHLVVPDTTIETILLKCLSIREQYNTYIEYVDLKAVLPTTKILLLDYKKYFDGYEKNIIDFGEFYTCFSQEWHSSDMEQSDYDYFKDWVFPAILNCEETHTENCLNNLIKKQYTEKLITSIKNDFNLEQINEILTKYEESTKGITNKENNLKTASLIDLEQMDDFKGIPWFLPSFQKSMISLLNGQLIVVSADWGTGKSAFVISQVVHAFKYLSAQGSDRPIWYINSEGTEGDVLVRFWSNLYKDKIIGGFEEIWEKRQKVLENFNKNFNEKLFIVSHIDNFSDFNKIQQQTKKLNPSMLIIDIADELVKEEDPQSLKKLYGQLRRLSVNMPIICTTQSGDTSYLDEDEKTGKKVMRNQKWLSGSKTYGSKTGKPGAADTIITIGKEDEHSPLRFISVPKKKRGQAVKVVCELVDKYSWYKELGY